MLERLINLNINNYIYPDSGVLIFILIVAVLILFYLHIYNLKKKIEKETIRYRRIEKELRDTEQRFLSLSENIPGVIYTYTYDAVHTMNFISDGIETLSGYPASDFILNRVRSYIDIIHPDDQAEVIRLTDRSLSNKTPFELEYRIINADGGIRWVYEKGVCDLNNMSDGEPLIVNGYLMEISRQKYNEEEIKRRYAMLYSLIDSVPDLIYYKDRKGIFLGCNISFGDFVGLSPYKVAGKTDYDLFPKQVADIFRENDLKMLSKMKPRLNEELIEYPAGRKILLETLTAPLVDADGKLLGIVCMSRDKTPEKENAS
jgi:PAS domain S-box-containing protein